jgi:hypothetical protein
MLSSGGIGLRLRIMALLAAMLKGPRSTRQARSRLNRSSILRRNRARHNRGGVQLMGD